MASDSPARARLPTCTAAPMALPSIPLSLVASSCSCVVNRVSTPMFTVFHRNFPASQYTGWPWSSWHTIIWLALPLIWCLITASPRSESDEDSEALRIGEGPLTGRTMPFDGRGGRARAGRGRGAGGPVRPPVVHRRPGVPEVLRHPRRRAGEGVRRRHRVRRLRGRGLRPGGGGRHAGPSRPLDLPAAAVAGGRGAGGPRAVRRAAPRRDAVRGRPARA